MTPEGAVLARPAPAARAGEERWAAAALAGLGIPLIASMRGRATFEGADALWLTDSLIAVGVGVRTNEAGFAIVRSVLRDLGGDAVAVPPATPNQHLLGTFVVLDRDLAVALQPRVPAALVALARELGYDLLTFEVDPEIMRLRPLNFVAVAPRVVIKPAGVARVDQALCAAGVRAVEVSVEEYLHTAGGIACATGILHRS